MFEDITYENILNDMLSRVPNDIDKRPGSIIYDALAPAAYKLAEAYFKLRNYVDLFFADTAVGEFLSRRTAELGIVRQPATKAIRKIITDVPVDVGTRWGLEDTTYIITEKISDTEYKAECEQLGSIGNAYSGTLDNIDNISGVTAELTDILIPGEDEETDESLRQRYFESLVSQAYGGNITDYKEKVSALPGVGGVKVEPVWNGGGTVKLTIIDSDYNKPSATLIDEVQTAVDPEQNQGKGYGIAPIGHVVTVVGADEEEIDVEPEITLQTGYTWEDVKSAVETAINDYFKELRSEWAEFNSLVIRISQIEVRILDIAGIVDVQNTKLNGQQQNIELGPYEIPVVGEVTPQ
ncbi:MAG: Baseplate-J domain-containing protein [Clostridium sp.]